MRMIKTINTQDQKLLGGLLQADNQAVKQIYDLALPSVISWVKENNGTEADARDIFQEALIALFRRLEGNNFTLTCTLKSFLRIMCRNLWLARIRDSKKVQLSAMDDAEEEELDEQLLIRLERAEQEQLFFKHFDALGDNCRKILQWFFDKVPLKEIAEKLNTSEGYIKKRKFTCKERLIKAIQSDPVFGELSSKA